MVWARSLTNQRKLKDSIGCIQCEQPITDTWTFNHKANEFKWNIELLFQSNKPASPHPVGSPSRKPVTRTNGANGKWQHIIHHVTAKTTLSTTADTWLELNIAYFTDTSSQKQQFTCWHQSTQVTICNMLFFWFALPPPPKLASNQRNSSTNHQLQHNICCGWQHESQLSSILVTRWGITVQLIVLGIQRLQFWNTFCYPRFK